MVAVDIGARATYASNARGDAAESMRRDKLDYYESHFAELERQGIVYAPMTFTAYGRRHPDATNMLQHAATKVVRQRGRTAARGLLKFWERQIAAEIWRRAARMVRICLPKWRPPPTTDDAEAEDIDET